jgi:thiamine-phosphate pyrophosphorylase
LGDPRLYLVAPARLEAGELAALVPELAEAGVDLIQLREKDMEAGDLLRAGAPILQECRAVMVPFIINDRPDVARALGADGVHVGQNDLPAEATRAVFGEGIVGLSTHAEREIDHALSLRDVIDYFCVGPVHATPTKEGRPAVGLGLLRYAAQRQEPVPWFAIGGIDASNLDDVMGAGVRRIVVVRAITRSPDPPAAAAALKQRLLTA